MASALHFLSSQGTLGKPVSLSTSEALSGITGSISLAAWIFVFVPQLLENYHNQNADGLSLLFVLVWTIGDIANVTGAIWANLVPTVIAIGIYFCFSDSVILLQSFYYKLRNRSAASASTSTLKDEEQALTGTALEPPLPTEDDPLLSQRPPSSYSGRRPSQPSGTLAEKRSSSSNALSRDLLSVALVCAAGACGWAIAWQAGAWRPTSEAPDEEGGASMVLGAQALGYFSAVCYLGARVPQIRKNYRERSCEGLSRLFFMLSILGNVTYGAGILFHSLDERYILTNLPWLIGSLGTLAEDFVIFFQFHLYRRKD